MKLWTLASSVELSGEGGGDSGVAVCDSNSIAHVYPRGEWFWFRFVFVHICLYILLINTGANSASNLHALVQNPTSYNRQGMKLQTWQLEHQLGLLLRHHAHRRQQVAHDEW